MHGSLTQNFLRDTNFYTFAFQLIFTVRMATSDSFDCQLQIFEGKVDCCSISERSMTSSYINVFLRSVLKADFDLHCPYRAGSYTITNLTFGGLPRMPLPSNAYLCTTEKYFIKTSDRKSMRLVATVHGQMSYES
jgi:hypothetical protein